MKNGIFRKVALARLSSPEQLDSLLQVTTLQAWFALLGIAVLLAAVLSWSVLGAVPTKLVAQQCILVKSGGVNSVTAPAGGRLSDLSVLPGDVVTRGQIIGRIDQNELLQKIQSYEARLKEAEAQQAQTVLLAQQSNELRDSTLARQVQGYAAQAAAAAQKVKLLKERIESQTRLYEQGLITRQTLINSQLELSSTELEGETIKAQLKQLEVQRLEARKQVENEVARARIQVEDVKRSIGLLLREANSSSNVVSPYAGRVLEVKVSEGQLVDRGSGLLSIEAAGADINEIEAYIYLPAADGKRVTDGMKVEISPSTAKREEYGFLPGTVSQVADYPSTDEGLMRVFGNAKLVQQLSGSAPPIQIQAALKPSAHSPSNYAWSTRMGPPFQIQSGTSCAASIVLAEQRPIAMVMPILKKTFGLD
jgi:HlyD family secretion protein